MRELSIRVPKCTQFSHLCGDERERVFEHFQKCYKISVSSSVVIVRRTLDISRSATSETSVGESCRSA